MSAISITPPLSTQTWQLVFLHVLPEIRDRAALDFRHLGGEAKEEATQEAVASACVAFKSLASRGCLGAVTAGTLSNYAVKHVRSGRHVGGSQEGARDVMSRCSRSRHRVNVVSYDAADDSGDPWQRSLIADKRASIPDLAAFRIDFRHWLNQMDERDRQIISTLATGEHTRVVAERFGVTAGRISQLRREYERDWNSFHGEPCTNDATRTGPCLNGATSGQPNTLHQQKGGHCE
jgi:hypothetical protein